MKTVIFPLMHVSLYVRSIAETVKFYDKFFGKTADKVKPNYAKYILDSPSLIISFVENPEKVQPYFGHLGFQVKTVEEMEQKLQSAKAAGLATRDEIGTSCCYAKQDKFWVADPDGVQWEVYYFHEDVEFNDPHYSNSESSACCMPEETAAVTETATSTSTQKMKVDLSELQESCSTPGGGCC